MAGQYYFAWVDETETAFLNAHKRFDEDVFSFQLHQAEGDFASLDIVLRNPRVGLLAPGRKTWAWLAYEHPTEGTKPLFFGRLVAVPEDLQLEQVQLSFLARPLDFAAQKLAVAETLKVAPFWDPIWFSPESRADPDNVLESRCELWHIDPRTLVVTSSNIVTGEDGTIAVDEGEAFYDSVRVRYGQAPARRVSVQADVSWDQKAKGSLDVTQAVIQAFALAQSGDWRLISSYTGEGLVNNWPKDGASIGGGWSVARGKAEPIFFKRLPIQFEASWFLAGTENLPTGLPFESFQFDSGFQPHGGLVFPLWYMKPTLQLSYDVSRRKGEVLSFEMEADVQSVVTDPGDEEVVRLKLSSSEVAEPIDYGGAKPIDDQRARSYFTTTRGKQSIEYLLMLARAHLLSRARCVFIDLEIPLDSAIAADLTCRKNMSLSDERLPGGIAAGKIIEFTMQFDGDTGAATCSVTFACTVGKDGAISADPGEPTWVEDDYVENEYQVHDGEVILPLAGEVGYTSIAGQAPDDDGIDFKKMNPNLGGKLVKDINITNPAAEQGDAMPFHGPETTAQPLGTWHQYYLVEVNNGFRPDYEPQKAIEALNAIPTTVELQMHDMLGGPFNTEYDLVVTDLKVPKLIDLEAPSSP